MSNNLSKNTGWKTKLFLFLLVDLIFVLLFLFIYREKKEKFAFRATLQWLGLQGAVQHICVRRLLAARRTLRDSSTVLPHSRWSAATSNSSN